MGRVLVVAACLSLAISACGDPAAEPSEIVDRMFRATAAGDNSAWPELYAKDAVAVFPDGSSTPMFGAFDPIRDDFDGDGVLSWADDTQFRNAMHGPARQEMSWLCATVGEGWVECSVTVTDAWIEAGGADALVTTARFAVEAGEIVEEEFLGSPDSAQMEATLMVHFEEVTTYERWLIDTHPDRYTTLFHGPCGQGNLVGLPAAIVLHDKFIDEFLAATGYQHELVADSRGRSCLLIPGVITLFTPIPTTEPRISRRSS